MFYEVNKSLQEVDADKIDNNILTVGCISSEGGAYYYWKKKKWF